MSSLVVSGLPIRIQPSNVSTDRFDATDRAAAFDNTYRVSVTGGVRRDFHFQTPPVSATDFSAYMGVLSNPAPQTCSGDVISIPTMCCPETPTWTPVRISGVNYYVISFTLHEIQSAKLLLKYSPGDTITGETFTRSTVGYQIGAGGTLNSVAINTKRDSHWITVRNLLLEGASTNNVLWASDFNNAAWVKTTMTVGTGIADPAGGTTACTLTASGASATAQQTLANSTNIVRTNSCWIRRRTGTGIVQIVNPNNIGYTTVALTGAYQRFQVVGASGIGRAGGILIATNGDAIDVWDFQNEDLRFASSEIVTTTVALARGSDNYSLPFTQPPVEMSVYVRFIEKGTALAGGVAVCISTVAAATPNLQIYTAAGVYRAFHHNGSTAVDVPLGVGPALGDTVELLLRLFGDGSVDITQSLNGGASTSSTQSAANALAAAWSGPLCWLNSSGNTGYGYGAYQSLKVVGGARSLSEMRAI